VQLIGRVLRALTWRWQRRVQQRRARRLERLARRLGFPAWDGEAAGDEAAFDAAGRPAAIPGLGWGGEMAAATVCTLARLPQVGTLAASLRRHHGWVELVVLVVDAETANLPAVEGAVVVCGEEIGFPPDPYLLLTSSAAELCRLARPALLRHLAAAGSRRKLVYLEPDVWLLAPLTALLARLDDHDFVVMPRMLEPTPHPERWWERPDMASIAAEGIFDDGLFGLRCDAAAVGFLRAWAERLAAPRPFADGGTGGLGLDWLPAFSDSLHVLRDPVYAVAHWNLHERALDRRQDVYTVAGRPLVSFRFDGFDPGRPEVLSTHDTRHDPFHHGPLTALLRDYAAALEAAGREGVRAYRFGRFASGLGIDRRMRRAFRRHPALSRPGVDPFGAAGERLYGRALLSPAPGSGSLAPPLLREILDERPDLRRLAPHAETDPLPLLRWFAGGGAEEYGYAELFDRHRPVVPSRAGLEALGETANRRLLLDGVAEPLGGGRTAFVERHRGLPLAEAMRTLEHERYAISPLWLVRRLVEADPRLRNGYPDLLFADAERFAAWLDVFAWPRGLLPPACTAAFRRTCGGRSLARVYAHLAQRPPLAEEFPLALVGHRRYRFAQRLLGCAGTEPGLEIDDVVMYLWAMEERPEQGLEATLSLPRHRGGGRNPEELLAPVLGDRRLASALQDRRWRRGGREGASAPPAGAGRFGVNVFGYFKSPIGLGYMSRGLAAALEGGGVPVTRSVLPHKVLDADVFPDDFVPRCDPRFTHDLLVGVPHDREIRRHGVGAGEGDGRRQVAYLAWEQPTAPAHWEETFRDFDQVWALSDFAAASLGAALRRPVVAVPCALDLDALPPPVDKRRAGVREDRFSVLYVFDPESSVERKNPLAAVDAVAEAFRGDDRVQLVVRLAHYRAARHRTVAERIATRAAERSVDLVLLTRPMERRRVLALISAADCYLSLHRAEGFGLTCAEAMAYGVPTVATGYSGNLTFMDGSCSLLVDYEEREVLVPDGPFRRGSRWAEPSVGHAAKLLRTLHGDRALGREIGERGRRRVHERLALPRVAAIAVAALEGREAPGGGAGAVEPAEVRALPAGA